MYVLMNEIDKLFNILFSFDQYKYSSRLIFNIEGKSSLYVYSTKRSIRSNLIVKCMFCLQDLR